jgi:hypothetical protein
MDDTGNPNPAAPGPASTAAAPPAGTHKKECGDVGATGAHGDIGSNKA